MRIAVSGSHRVGKSTLVAALADALPRHVVVDEPYVQLADDGHDFAAYPSVEDFESQLARSLADLRDVAGDAIFDRSPVDFVAYFAVHEDGGAFRLGDWTTRIRRAVRTLDLVVFVGVEQPDRVPVAADERALRAAVDERMRDLLLDDELDLRVPVLAVRGDVEQRAAQVVARRRR